MIKYFMGLALALSVATPVQAQTVAVDMSRFEQLVKVAPTVCRTAREMGSNMGDNVENIMKSRGATVSERLLMLSMCKAYIHGMVDATSGSI